LAGFKGKLGEFQVQVLIYLSRYLDQETAKWPLRFSSQVTICYYYSKVKAIPLSLNKRTCRPISILMLSLFNAERQAG